MVAQDATTKSYGVKYINLDVPSKITTDLLPALLSIDYVLVITAKRTYNTATPPVATDTYDLYMFKPTLADSQGTQTKVNSSIGTGRVVVMDQGKLLEMSLTDAQAKYNGVV